MKIINHNKLNESISNIGAVERIANNIDKIKDVGVEVHADLPYAAAAQIAVSKEKKDAFDKAMKEKEDEVKDFTQDRETAKVSTPAMKKMHLSESLFDDFEEEKEILHEAKKPTFDSLYDEIDTILEGGKTLIVDGSPRVNDGLGFGINYQIGPVPPRYDKEGYDGIQLTIDPREKDSTETYITDFEKAKEAIKPYEELGVVMDETKELVSLTPKTHLEKLLIYIPQDVDAPNWHSLRITTDKEPNEEVDTEAEETVETESLEECNESIEKAVEMSIHDFEPWDGAVSTYEKIDEAGKLDEFEGMIEELYPDGLSEEKLNDLLWFESDWIFNALNINEEEE